MKKINDTFVKMDSNLALSIANCRDENKVYIINGTVFQWEKDLYSFLVGGIQKTASTVYAELSCDYSKLGKISFVEYLKY